MQPERIEHFAGDLIADIVEFISLILVISGLLIRVFTVGFVPRGTSGRNTNKQVAAELNTTGMYSITRNPLYLGNAITYMGIALFTQDLFLVSLFGLFLIIYYERVILAEENFLKERFSDQYEDWVNRIPTFFPKISLWHSPALPFSLKTVLRREYPGVFAATLMLSYVEIANDYFEEGFMEIDSEWLWVLVIVSAIYVGLRFLKKHTQVLDVAGR